MQYKVEIECGGALLKSLPKCKMTFWDLPRNAMFSILYVEEHFQENNNRYS